MRNAPSFRGASFAERSSSTGDFLAECPSTRGASLAELPLFRGPLFRGVSFADCGTPTPLCMWSMVMGQQVQASQNQSLPCMWSSAAVDDGMARLPGVRLPVGLGLEARCHPACPSCTPRKRSSRAGADDHCSAGWPPSCTPRRLVSRAGVDVPRCILRKPHRSLNDDFAYRVNDMSIECVLRVRD